MNNQFLTVKTFLDRIKSIGFWDRLFYWGEVRRELIEAATGLASLQNDLTTTQSELASTQMHLSVMQETKRNLDLQLQAINKELGTHKERSQNSEREAQTVRELNIQLKKEDEFRAQRYSEEIFSLQSIKQSLMDERAKEIQYRHEEEMERLKALKETWALHQTDVQGRMKQLCQKHTLHYVDKAPFRGEPDNTLMIAEEYVVFDAKSPSGDDLKNFPLYLKAQAESAKKYAKLEGVKKDVFLVVPTNTLACVKEFVYNLGDYDVYVVSTDVLEPLILSLCKIEDYEFAEQLSPEDRENICRIIGKFAHLSKRRIQIDAFFARQFIELAYKCENSLPTDVLEKVLEFERSEKLNPPMEKRAKAISTKDLEIENGKIEMEVSAKGVALPNDVIALALNEANLYR